MSPDTHWWGYYPNSLLHDDVIKWKHFPRYWPFVRGIHRSPVNSPHKGQWCGALMFTLICARINGWVNNREAGDLRRYRAHCDVIVMYVFKSHFKIGHACVKITRAQSSNKSERLELKIGHQESNPVIFTRATYFVSTPDPCMDIGHRCIPFTKASNAELWCFHSCAPEVQQTVDMLVISDAMALIVTSL